MNSLVTNTDVHGNDLKGVFVTALMAAVFTEIEVGLQADIVNITQRHDALSSEHTNAFIYKNDIVAQSAYITELLAPLDPTLVEDYEDVLESKADIERDKQYVKSFLAAVFNHFTSKAMQLHCIPEPLHQVYLTVFNEHVVDADVSPNYIESQALADQILSNNDKALLIIKLRLMEKLLQ